MSRCTPSRRGLCRDAVVLLVATLGLTSCSGGDGSVEPAGDGGVVEAATDAEPDFGGEDVALPGQCHFDDPASFFDGSCQMVP